MSSWFSDLSSKLTEQVQQATTQAHAQAQQYLRRHEEATASDGSGDEEEQNIEKYLPQKQKSTESPTEFTVKKVPEMTNEDRQHQNAVNNLL